MKRIIKNPLLTFILGLIISGSVVYAATLIASHVTFDNTKTSMNADNVQDAIDELYTKVNEQNMIDLINIDSEKISTKVDYGDKATKTLNYNFDAGSYLIFGVSGYAIHNKTIQPSNGETSYPKPLNTNDCQNVTGKYAKSVASTQFGNSNVVLYTTSSIYKCIFNTNTSVTFTTENWGAVNTENSNLMISAIKLD